MKTARIEHDIYFSQVENYVEEDPILARKQDPSHDPASASELTDTTLLSDHSRAPVIFLDFDGVTHPEPCFQENVFCRFEQIAAVLNRYPQLAIVISSSWRMQYSLSELQGFLAAMPTHRVVAVTPSIKKPSPDWLPGVVPEYERQWEIETWMKANRPWGTPWIALDDRAQWFAPNCPNLLLTDRSIGFSDADALVLEEMIKDVL